VTISPALDRYMLHRLEKVGENEKYMDNGYMMDDGLTGWIGYD